MASDGLTWLASRQALSDALTDEASAGRDTPGGDGTGGWTSRIGLLLLDVDRFSDLVASLGPDGGQDVLAQIATRLRPALRPNQMLARLGGTSSPSSCRTPIVRLPSGWPMPSSPSWMRPSG